jgi:hypothetical protein
MTSLWTPAHQRIGRRVAELVHRDLERPPVVPRHTSHDMAFDRDDVVALDLPARLNDVLCRFSTGRAACAGTVRQVVDDRRAFLADIGPGDALDAPTRVETARVMGHGR